IEAFRIEDVNHSPAFFDDQKLLHFNGVYIRALPTAEFTARCKRWATETADPLGTDLYDSAAWDSLAPLVQERVALLKEVPGYVGFYFAGEFAVEEASWAKAVAGDELAPQILAAVRKSYEALEPWVAPELKAVLEGVAEVNGRKLGKAQAP